jgi:hypothetical protein
MYIRTCLALLCVAHIASATNATPEDSAKFGLSDDQTKEEMAKTAAKLIHKWIGKKVTVKWQDTPGSDGKCSLYEKGARNSVGMNRVDR